MKVNSYLCKMVIMRQEIYMFGGPNDDDDDIPEEWTD